MELIDKDKVVAEIEKTYKFHEKRGNEHDSSICDVLYGLSHRIDTLETKEVYEHNDSDLDSVLEEIGVESDSKLAKMFRTAFYKSIDTYLAKKGE